MAHRLVAGPLHVVMRHAKATAVFACCAFVTAGHLVNAATELMKLDHEEPQLTEPYLSKQKKLMVSSVHEGLHLYSLFCFCQ